MGEGINTMEGEEEDSIKGLLDKMINDIVPNEQLRQMVDKMNINEESDELIPDLKFGNGKIKEKKSKRSENNQFPSLANSNSSRKSALGMVIHAVRNLKEQFGLDNSHPPENKSDSVTDNITIDEVLSEETESVTKRSREERKGPTIRKGEGDIECSSSSKQKQTNKNRKINVDGMEIN